MTENEMNKALELLEMIKTVLEKYSYETKEQKKWELHDENYLFLDVYDLTIGKDTDFSFIIDKETAINLYNLYEICGGWWIKGKDAFIFIPANIWENLAVENDL